jgi:rhodanese-related sulfurtransferase
VAAGHIAHAGDQIPWQAMLTVLVAHLSHSGWTDLGFSAVRALYCSDGGRSPRAAVSNVRPQLGGPFLVLFH